MAKNDLLYEVEEQVATITLNRPERMNALTVLSENELIERFVQADDDRSVRVIILTGAGYSFCAGFDQGGSGGGNHPADPAGKPIADLLEFWQRHDGARIAKWQTMWRLGKPIIAAVNGWAMGAGFWYQLASDITIAFDRAVFAQPEVVLGMAGGPCRRHLLRRDRLAGGRDY